MIDQFMSPVWNLRTDEYGGSPENCARFPVEIVQAIKSVVGNSMPVIFRISLDHRFPGGRTMEDSLKLLKILEAAGVDEFDVDAGCYETLDYILTKWYTVQLEKLNVDVRLNTAITGDEDILAECDRIIVGCGAVPVMPAIPGIDGENVISVLDAHRDLDRIKGDNIVVCGGGASGLDCALELASEMGRKVTVVEMLPQCGKDVFFINQITLFRKLEESGVTLMTDTKVVAMDESGLTVEGKDGEQKKIAADTIIAAFGMRQDLSVVDKIKEKYHIKTRVVGDSARIGKIGEAVRDGFYAATSL